MGNRSAVQNCVVRLLFPQGKVPLVQASGRTMPCPSARRVFGWLVGWRKLAVEEPRSADHERFVQALCKIEPAVGEVRSLAREFLGLMHRRSLLQFDRWLRRLSRCDAAEMRRFAQSLRADLPAVRAAFKLPWQQWPDRGSRQPAQVPQAPDVWPSEHRASAAAGIEVKLNDRPALSCSTLGRSPSQAGELVRPARGWRARPRSSTRRMVVVGGGDDGRSTPQHPPRQCALAT